MAKKAKYDWGRSSAKPQKFETRLTFKCAVTQDTADSAYIDLGLALSAVNRKLVRQGQFFRVRNMRLFSSGADAGSSQWKVGALPRTWTFYNAYRKARSLWNQHNLEALQGVGAGNLPKYYDYKVFMDKNHFRNVNPLSNASMVSTGQVGALMPCDMSGTALTGGEWVYSSYEDSGSTARQFFAHVLGEHQTQVGADEGDTVVTIADQGSCGLILAYQQSRGLPNLDQDSTSSAQQGPATLYGGPWGVLFGDDEQTQQTITHLAADNDDAPYDVDAYVGASTEHSEPVLVGTTHISTGGNMVGTVPVFEAPLGLIRLEFNANGVTADTGDVWITLDTEILGSV